MPDQVISNTGFESPCSTKVESCRFSPLETPSTLCLPREAGFRLNKSKTHSFVHSKRSTSQSAEMLHGELLL
jgi:hypothetical protein